MLDAWEKCQNANGDGYIGGVPGSKKLWADVAAGKIAAGGFDLNKTWVPLYNIHKTYSGLHDAFVYAKSEKAKKMLVKFSDWMLNLPRIRMTNRFKPCCGRNTAVSTNHLPM